VRLPRAEARPLEPKSGLVVHPRREGRIFMDQAPLSYADFRATFPAFVRTKRPTGCTSVRRSGPVRRRGAGARGDPRGGRERCRSRRGAGGGQAMRRGRVPRARGRPPHRAPSPCTRRRLFLVAGAAAARNPFRRRIVCTWWRRQSRPRTPRKAPEAVDRPAEANPHRHRRQVAEEHGVPGPAAAGDGQHQARGGPAHDAQRGAAPGEKPSTGSDVATVSTEGVEFPFPSTCRTSSLRCYGFGSARSRARPRGGGLVPGTSRRVGERSPAPQALGELCVRPRSAGGRRAGGAHQGVPRAPDGWDADVLFVRFYFSGKRQ